MAGFVASAFPAPAARAQGLPLIRDTEIELLLNDYSQKIFRAAGLGTGRVTVRIVNNEAFNAFVIDGRNVFMHTGTLMQANTPNEVIGVLAHEAGHIAGGHMAALRSRIAKDQTRALLIQLLGIGAMIGGAVSGGDSGKEIGSAGQGVMMGGNELIMRGLTAERRSQESAADQAGLQYLNATQQSGRGMLATFERFAGQELFSDAHKDAFARTHPVATDRLARLRQLVESSPYFDAKDPAELQLRHDMVRAKLSGYIEPPAVVFNRYPPADTSLPARYARAIASFRRGGAGGLDDAVAAADALIRDRPNNPYFWEVKGDFLQKGGRAEAAIAPFRKALQLHNGDAPLVGVQLAQALLQTKNPAVADEAINLLRKAVQREPDNASAYNTLGQAYYDKGMMPQSELARAQGLFYFGALKQAQEFAKRAQGGLKAGSPDWVKADDIINYKPQT
ncbi:M48 family metalloprotease [Hyphomicrobium sp. LHD-15]|uniref:M48 family metalloprotease n=1 Tax=Hyphomicrobium sp. LHD-15 TaxID=3072142 RepID=UPI00280D4B26|nr:M48 family metalloprotease [Hyphomicrobium sp. LHD-15]MDQ8699297.1 M48 family metalloprotease [Hyphomicrobium sp. LHD-15]